jgi:hypothetical protein
MKFRAHNLNQGLWRMKDETGKEDGRKDVFLQE